MMKKENLKALLIVVLIVLSVMFFMGFYFDNKVVVQGLGIIPQMGCTCTDDGKSVGGGSCLSWNKPKYCLPKGDPPECSIVDNCQECGCEPPFGCEEGGSCSRYGHYCGDGNCDDDETVNNCPEDCDDGGGPECPSGSCTDDDGDGIPDETGDCGDTAVCDDGCCAVSYCGDGICDYREERCDSQENCFADCLGKQAFECQIGEICIEAWPDAPIGECGAADVSLCEDQTPDETCSNVTHGGYCQYDTDAEDYLLTGSCGGLCPCPEDYVCEEDGFCILDNTTQGSPPGEEPVEIDNYCEYVGGICQEECSANYFALDENEYPELVEDCQDEDSSYNCCYPYENDDVNYCEYYGGSCLASCGDDSYHSEIDYIDDECVYYGDVGDICCIPYDIQTEDSTEEVNVDGSWIDDLFGGDGEDGKDSDAKLSENISLNRGVIISMVLLVIGLGALVYLFLRTNKGKR
jgi:hypothetical protein